MLLPKLPFTSLALSVFSLAIQCATVNDSRDPPKPVMFCIGESSCKFCRAMKKTLDGMAFDSVNYRGVIETDSDNPDEFRLANKLVDNNDVVPQLVIVVDSLTRGKSLHRMSGQRTAGEVKDFIAEALR